MYVCLCNNVTESDIRDAARNGACSLECLQERLGVSTCCGQCEPAARDCLAENQRQSNVAVPAPQLLTATAV